MPAPIEDYALLGDCHTAALVSRAGSIDWLCLPRFDSPSLFGALLGTENHGRWLLSPADPAATCSRTYDGDTFTLVTTWTTSTGTVQVTECMPRGGRRADLVRRITGLTGTVQMAEDLRLRFDYADALPWVRQSPEQEHHALIAVAGPDAVILRGPQLRAEDHHHVAEFSVSAGDTVDLTLTWYPSHREPPGPLDVTAALAHSREWWHDWAAGSTADGPYAAAVRRSLLVLRALTHDDTGGIVAAATTSLPEQFGGSRNWDYRYVWLRDASLTLEVLLAHGYIAEAQAWRTWLLGAIAGDPADVQIMYGIAGERRLPEWEVASLPGYDGAAPVRVGNEASAQLQGDVFGELMVALHEARLRGVSETDYSWPLQRALMGFVEHNWQRPDSGIWEIRGAEQRFTHSQVMLWAALDRAIAGVEHFGLEGPVERWRALRTRLAAEIEEHGFDHERGTYRQHFGGDEVDAALLQLPQVGYLAWDDPRMLGTVRAIEEDLLRNGLVMRYRSESGVDGLPVGENSFLACSFWLVEQYAHTGRVTDAHRLMDRLLGFANDVGLLSEQYDVDGARQAGNTPQALSHLALVRASDAIAQAMRD